MAIAVAVEVAHSTHSYQNTPRETASHVGVAAPFAVDGWKFVCHKYYFSRVAASSCQKPQQPPKFRDAANTSATKIKEEGWQPTLQLLLHFGNFVVNTATPSVRQFLHKYLHLSIDFCLFFVAFDWRRFSSQFNENLLPKL